MMGNSYANAVSGGPSATHTVTNLKRWSCSEEKTPLPAPDTIRTIHVYDFDNTLFASPLPNRQIWDGSSLGKIMAEDTFANGGWWHDPTFLSATGEGVEKEEQRAWSGWWNEQIAELCELSVQQKDAISILLTGRGEAKFADLIKRMVKSKGLSFHMICLKPAVNPNGRRIASTMAYKQELLAEVMYTYKQAEEIKIYEDRPHHVDMFRDWLQDFNHGLAGPDPKRPPIKGEVVQVAMEATNLDPVAEVAQVQQIINEHNTAFKNGKLDRRALSYLIKSQVVATGYLLKTSDTKKLIEQFVAPEIRNGRGVKIHADAIPIAMGTGSPHVLTMVGGIGHKVRFDVVAHGHLEDRVWAVRVQPTNSREQVHTLNHPASVVLALKDARARDVNEIEEWTQISPHQATRIETTVGEKALLSILPEASPAQKRRYRDENDAHHGHARGGGSYRGGNPGRGRGQNRRDEGGSRGRGKSAAGRGGSGRGRAGYGHTGFRQPGYTDHDAGGGRRDQGGTEFYNAY